MTDISVFTDEDLSGIGIGPEHGVAMSRINSLITEVNDINDYVVVAKCVGLNLMSETAEVSAALNGNSTKKFVPTEVLVVCTAVTGNPGDSRIDIGTTTGGNNIDAAADPTTLGAVGESLRLPISTVMPAIAGNATLYVSTNTVESVATVFTVNVYIIGRQF